MSFTDLFIGILFLFLILVAALMLMHQEAIRREKEEAQLMSGQIQQAQAKLDAAAKFEAEHPAFRLGIVFNIYQRPSAINADWTFSRTVQVFRAQNGLCINNVLLRSNLSTAWKPPIEEKDIPTSENQTYIQLIDPCVISASRDHWDYPSETGELKRVSANLYDGGAVLHKQGGDVKLDIQYRVLGVYDDYFR